MGKKILIVEDEEVIRHLFKRVLTPLGHDLNIVPGVRDAIAQLETNVFDLLISDLRLQDGIGTDVARAYLQKQPGHPVLIVTGSLSPGERLGELENIPNCHCLHKPVELHELQSKIDQLLA